MEKFRRPLKVLLAFVLALWASVAGADGLYDQPVLRIDPGHHSASLRRADVDAAGRFLVTGAHDKTVRVWDAVTGKLLRTIHMPQGPGDIGKVYAVAISPDGRLVAAGGWTRTGNHNIYIFDRDSGAMVARLDGLPNVVLHLAFSPDGQRLAATLFGKNGLRLYQPQGDGWAELARDTEYGGNNYWAAFSADGQRLVTTSYDGKLRLYTSDGELLRVADSGGKYPFGVAFHLDGSRIAVGFVDSTNVRVFDAADLSFAYAADTAGVSNGNLGSVAWSADGQTLYAGGLYDVSGENPVLRWDAAGRGARRNLSGGLNSVMTILPLSDGDVLAAAADPWLARMSPDGAVRWRQPSRKPDYRNQRDVLSVSHDGTRVGFGVKQWGEDAAVFDVLEPQPDAGVR